MDNYVMHVPDSVFDAVVAMKSPYQTAEFVRMCARGKMRMTEEQELRAIEVIGQESFAADRVVGGITAVTHLLTPRMSEALREVAQTHEDHRMLVISLYYLLFGCAGFYLLLTLYHL